MSGVEDGVRSLAERQATWLTACLESNADTAFGRHFGFGRLRSPDEYRARVPLASYEDLSPWIDRMANGEADVLIAGRPVAFEMTGGSTGGRKVIPYSSSSLADFAKAIVPWLSDLVQRYQVEEGTAYWSVSPAARAPQEMAGTPVGLPDGAYLDERWRRILAETSVVPPWISELTGIDTWRLATLYLLVCREDLRLISVWSPTFLLALLDGLEELNESLRAILAQGGVIADNPLPPNLSALEKYEAFLDNKELDGLWPRLGVVSCWADGSSRPFFDQLRARLPRVDFQPKGLLLTEGVVTVPDAEGRCVLAGDSGFFEFLSDDQEGLFAHQLRAGDEYEVVMTTSGGLYRYRTGDRVRCEDQAERGPVLRFLGRTTLTSDLVGEKLTEAFVDQCLQSVAGFRMLVPMHTPPGYLLVVDARERGATGPRQLEEIEAALSRNPQYAYARRLGQLAPLRLLRTHAPMRAYIDYMAGEGGRLGDIKVPALRPETHWVALFEEAAS